ncbi:hypothetical protein HDU79_011867 [Rhizoclosmatium sp. JEL0117]|nr:hypothetical protein HDU79_011867 [Rhizoclosmatium sp. JEL0117]
MLLRTLEQQTQLYNQPNPEDDPATKIRIQYATKLTGHGANQKTYGPFNFKNVIAKIKNGPLKARLESMDPNSTTYAALKTMGQDRHTDIRQSMSKKCFGQYGHNKAAAQRSQHLRLPLFAGYLFKGQTIGEKEKRRAALMRHVRSGFTSSSRKGLWIKVNAELARVGAMMEDEKERYYAGIVSHDERTYLANHPKDGASNDNEDGTEDFAED